MKPQSVRSQRSFQEHMATLYQGIDNLVYAAEVACDNTTVKCNNKLPNCPFAFDSMAGVTCSLYYLRQWIGDHTPQHDIEIPMDNTQVEKKARRK